MHGLTISYTQPFLRKSSLPKDLMTSLFLWEKNYVLQGKKQLKACINLVEEVLSRDVQFSLSLL